MVVLTIYIKPSIIALGPPASDQEDPQIPRRSRGNRHNHGDDVCGACCVRVMALSIIFLPLETYGAGIFPPEPIGLFLFSYGHIHATMFEQALCLVNNFSSFCPLSPFCS